MTMARHRRHLPLTAAIALLSAPAWSAATLSEALDLAWQRATQARVAESQRVEADAGRTAAESLFPEAPSIEISQRDDRLNANRGLRERELELTLPLWLPGQRDARLALAERESVDSDAAVAAVRLSLAGQLRLAVWSCASARAEAELARDRLAVAERLETDVARREAAGEMARTDLLLAREHTLAARAATAEARTRERQALEHYRVLTGLDTLPIQIDESVAHSTLTAHARQRLAETTAERARAAMQVARESGRDAPELAIGWQKTREEVSGQDINSVRIGLKIPFATAGRNAPRIAAANSFVIRAEAAYQQAMAELESEQRQALAALEDAELANEAAQARTAMAAERLRLLARAFDFGELALSELIRARGAANEARLQATRARIALSAAKAQVNQSKGVLP